MSVATLLVRALLVTDFVIEVLTVTAALRAAAAILKVPTTAPEAFVIVPAQAEPTDVVATDALPERTVALNGSDAFATTAAVSVWLAPMERTDGADADIFDLQVKDKYWNTYVGK